LDDVVIFSKNLIAEGCNFHPDDDFHNYINMETEKPSYSFDEAEMRNYLMGQCFQVCENNNTDIYNITMEVYLIETGLDKYIPSPSQLIRQ
jgi:hypothetical protein